MQWKKRAHINKSKFSENHRFMTVVVVVGNMICANDKKKHENLHIYKFVQIWRDCKKRTIVGSPYAISCGFFCWQYEFHSSGSSNRNSSIRNVVLLQESNKQLLLLNLSNPINLKALANPISNLIHFKSKGRFNWAFLALNWRFNQIVRVSIEADAVWKLN